MKMVSRAILYDNKEVRPKTGGVRGVDVEFAYKINGPITFL